MGKKLNKYYNYNKKCWREWKKYVVYPKIALCFEFYPTNVLTDLDKHAPMIKKYKLQCLKSTKTTGLNEKKCYRYISF